MRKLKSIMLCTSRGPMVVGTAPSEASDRLQIFQARFDELWRKYQTYSGIIRVKVGPLSTHSEHKLHSPWHQASSYSQYRWATSFWAYLIILIRISIDWIYLCIAGGEELFGLPVTEYDELQRIRRELGLLQKLYSLYNSVIENVNGYQDILWSDIDVEKINGELLEYQNR